MALHPIKYVFASQTNNKKYPTDQVDIENGIVYEGEVVSNQLNGIVELNQYALKELQTIGGYYYNNQIYNQNNIVFVLVNDRGLIKQRFYICKKDNVTQKPPLTGTSAGKYNDVDIINLVNSSEDSVNWDRVGVDDQRMVVYSTSGRYNYQFFEVQKPKGKITVSTYSSSALTMKFDIELSESRDFKFSNVFYSQEVRKSSNRYNGIYMGHPGFAVYANINPDNENLVLGVSVYDDTFIKRIEIDYANANFFNSAITRRDFSNEGLYAIREGGGTYIPNLGDIYHNIKNSTTAPNGDTYAFYLFARGCVPFSTAMVLNTKYYHQWNNEGMPSINIDVSDCYLVNKGAVMGQTNAIKLNESLPNIKSRTGNTYELGSNQQPAYAMNMSGEAYSIYGNSMGPGWEGALYMDSEKPNNVGFQSGIDFYATNQSVANGNNYFLYLKFDASKSNIVYQDGAPVRGKCLVTTFLLQAF